MRELYQAVQLDMPLFFPMKWCAASMIQQLRSTSISFGLT